MILGVAAVGLARVRADVGVRPLVDRERARVVEAARAVEKVASLRPNLEVLVGMNFEVAGLRERLAAAGMGAIVRLLAGVRAHVRGEDSRQREGLAALVAHERALASVRAHVLVEVAG